MTTETHRSPSRRHTVAAFVFAATATLAMLVGIGQLASVDSAAAPQLAQTAAGASRG